MGLGLVEQVTVEPHDGVQLAAHVFVGVLVIPVEGGVDAVVRGTGEEVDAHVAAVVHDLLQAEVALQGVGGRGYLQVTVSIPGAVIGKRGKVALEVDEPRIVVDDGTEDEGLSQHEVHAEEASEPVGLAHEQTYGEVVAAGLADGRQPGQGGEFGAHEVDERLGQRGVVELSLEFGIGEVALK